MGLILKRIFDFLLALISLIIFSPLILIIAIAIKLEDRAGTAIYSQERIGYKGRPFVLYKFRSMKMNAEDEGARLCQGEKDDRLTRVGAFIRAHHLDEFPQLWNVLKGDMSFVGPRPEREFYIKQIMERRPDYVRLYALRPGLFSYATLYNGYTDTIEKMIRRLDYDLQYLESVSMWTDVKIIFLTSFSIIFGKKF
ncbi:MULTISPECIES: sugar transferase [unclassified Porphyromonas]|uniref:sugar transferase n=1 Tax=unclassified Porphyromonas TaxID=2645799 RepID=UPI00052C7C23|nr:MULTISPECIES: sugar transferase [unclassified Porphyromonas]KGN84271.1 sugar transferase [Porphyromonas sp. COT-290 OH860]KGO01221.1 sugar transferase [Porphyromonas sp. COT-290 OH3588]